METSDEWIVSRTGIRERRFATHETLTQLAVEAARAALERAAPIRIPTDMSAASDYSRPSSSMIRRASSVLSITPRMASAPAP